MNVLAPYPTTCHRHGHTILRLSMGVLLHTLVTNMEQAVAESSRNKSSPGEQPLPKLFLYSGHDSTIMPVSTLMLHIFAGAAVRV